MAKLKKIGILFSAKLLGIYGAGVGLIAGIIYSFGGFIYDAIYTMLNYGTALAFLSLIGMPVMFALFGFILGIIGAIFYNLVIRFMGGIELDIEQ